MTGRPDDRGAAAEDRLVIGVVHRFPDPPGVLGSGPAEPYVVVHVEGEVDAETAHLLRERVLAAALTLAEVGPPRMALDLGQVMFLDSTGVGTLVAIWKAVLARDGMLMLAQPSPACRRILQRTGLADYIPTAPTVEAAITRLTG